MEYCQEIKIEGHACCAGEIEFWEKVMNSPEEQKEALDNLLICLGGAALGEEWRWSSSEYSNFTAWKWCYACGVWGNYYKNTSYYVRPVLDLSGLSY